MNLQKSMRPTASFIFENVVEGAQRLCLFPGHYNTISTAFKLTSTSAPAIVKGFISYADPSSIISAGYKCDQVADDFSLSENLRDESGNSYKVRVTPKSQKTSYRDFLNYIKLSGLKVVKMRITDLDSTTNPAHEIFYSEMEVTQSSIGSKAGSDYVQFAAHINPSNYLQNFIEVDLEERNLLLDETTLAFLDIPGKAKFQIDFTLQTTI